ncbi:MAG: hypothetical protein ACK5KP_04210 [Paludibacteraceae bacterium]
MLLTRRVNNVLKPGAGISAQTVEELTATYAQEETIETNIQHADKEIESAPLDFLVEIIPDNLFPPSMRICNPYLF